MKTLSVIFNKPPYGDQTGRELLDIALMAAAFDMTINAIFIDDGVYQLLDKQQPDVLQLKDHSRTFKALELYGIEDILVVSDDLQSRNITTEQLLPIFQSIEATQVPELLNRSDFVFML